MSACQSIRNGLSCLTTDDLEFDAATEHTHGARSAAADEMDEMMDDGHAAVECDTPHNKKLEVLQPTLKYDEG